MSEQRSSAPAGQGMGWLLVAVLVAAVCIAISLAVQLRPEQASPEPPRCGGLYNGCCVEWDDNWGPCIDDHCRDDARPIDRDVERDDGRGLFDAEENFADHRLPSNC